MSAWVDFVLFVEPILLYIIPSILLLAASASFLGTFMYLRKETLTGDVVAHAILPGVAMGFILSGTKNILFLVLGAFIFGSLSILFKQFVTRKTVLKQDAGLSITLVSFFSLGMLLLSVLQNGGNSSQSGLDKFLFGSAASITYEDALQITAIAIPTIIICILFKQPFTLTSFNPDFAASKGIKIGVYELIFSSLVILILTIGIQAVGAVLISGLFITPAAGARFWSKNVNQMLLFSILIAIPGTYLGIGISYLLPKMPTGPWIIVVISFITILSIFIAPEKGIIAKIWHRNKIKHKVSRENLIKLLYKMRVDHPSITIKKIQESNPDFHLKNESLKLYIHKLRKENLLQISKNRIEITENGEKEAKRIIKLHRLWEVYLKNKMNFATDHVHDSAESIEHFITPELEKLLIEELDHPKTDPHNNKIPYS
jgi:manganese/zinc/iron transport system permease protein